MGIPANPARRSAEERREQARSCREFSPGINRAEPRSDSGEPHGPNSPYFDVTAFKPVSEARFGTAGFNTPRGPGIANLEGERQLVKRARAITLRDVLTHTSGLAEVNRRDPHLTLEQTSKRIAARDGGELTRKQTGDLLARPGMPWGLGFSVVEDPTAMEANKILSPGSSVTEALTARRAGPIQLKT